MGVAFKLVVAGYDSHLGIGYFLAMVAGLSLFYGRYEEMVQSMVLMIVLLMCDASGIRTAIR